jgi:DNA (cytosine-5)-methyltransferase 1
LARLKTNATPGTRADEQASLFESATPGSVETFEIDRGQKCAVRIVERRDGSVTSSTVALPSGAFADSAEAFDIGWLRSSRPPAVEALSGTFRFVDLFSGCGAMSLGVWEACRALNLAAEPLLAVDINAPALRTYARNFPDALTRPDPVEILLDGQPGEPPTPAEEGFRQHIGKVDMLIGGPPCQGHSNLNNHTRRVDPKNQLYLRMARFAEIVRPEHILIENVPGAVHDRSGVVQQTITILQRRGYHVSTGVMNAVDIGVAQKRRRFFTVASLRRPFDFEATRDMYRRPARPLSWAIGDLEGVQTGTAFDSSAVHSPTNRGRIAYLFEHDLYDLPDDQRPDCHRLKTHSYKSVYGRLRPDEPTPTITTGFGSTGQGRYVHPTLQRTMTPHEAARVQFIPDFFVFADDRRRALQEMIGNAVPPKISYVIALELMR